MIRISKPAVVLATEQNVVVDRIQIIGIGKGDITAIVQYAIKNEVGKTIKIESISYKGEDYNAWWDNFNNGTFLLQEYISKRNLAGVTIDSKVIEPKFINPKNK